MILQNNQSSLSFVEPIIDSLMTEEENTAEDDEEKRKEKKNRFLCNTEGNFRRSLRDL